MGDVGYDFLEGQSKVSSARRGLDSAFLGAAEWTFAQVARHWLFLVNAIVGIFAGLPIAAPILVAIGAPGPANLIYYLYSFTCHQMPTRSWFIFDEKMAYCQRDNAIYLAMLAAGLVFGLYRTRLKTLSLTSYVLLILPMAIDGTTQLFGLRESTGLLRTITGALFGVASVWLAYPYIERAMSHMEADYGSPGPVEGTGDGDPQQDRAASDGRPGGAAEPGDRTDGAGGGVVP